ncbi:MAG: substrate-binding domain-containing protein [Anaerolineales bacterium]
MAKTPLFQKIAEAVRQDIVFGSLVPDDDLPTVREMAEKWHCAPGTVLRAYQVLAEQGLVTSRPGAGTQVASDASHSMRSPLRQATLINKTEAFLLQAIASGYAESEIEIAFSLALDRYKSLEPQSQQNQHSSLKFVGSHDPALTLLVSRLSCTDINFAVDVTFAGSLAGLMALARNEADFAGSHLWDEESNQYNRPYIRRLFPGKRIALVRLANRNIGLIVQPDNPFSIKNLKDLAHPNIRFINRQSGAGTRVWLDAHLKLIGIPTNKINGYKKEVSSHADIAGAVLDDKADVGLGIETAALGYGLDFIPLTTESYDLVVPQENWQNDGIQRIITALQEPNLVETIRLLGGYDTSSTGKVEWVTA